MSKKISIIAIILSAAAIVMSIINLVPVINSPDVQYVMYIGTNDQETNEPVCTPDEAKELVEEVLADHFGGYTIQEANGGWKENGELFQEYSVVAVLSDTNIAAVHAAADELCEKLHQSTVLIQENRTKTEFYAGGN